MDNTTVAPVTAYTQSRQTKLGNAVVAIKQEENRWKASVTISYDDTIFRAEGIFADAREAFLWAYGVKQMSNDRWAGYIAKDGVLRETKPPKTRKAIIISIADALREAQKNYNEFALSKSSVGDKISMSAVQASTALSAEDKATMEALFLKLRKQVKHA